LLYLNIVLAMAICLYALLNGRTWRRPRHTPPDLPQTDAGPL
jgi:hypothetical protein